MLDRTNHNRLAAQYARRIASIDDDTLPASDRVVTRGDNNPPGTIDRAREAFGELSDFLKDHPVIQAAPAAKLGSGYIERTRVALSEMESERAAKVKPLNDQLSAINGSYRAVRDPLETALKTLRKRLTDYANAIEEARIAEAERLRKEAEERERLAREAEAAEQDAIACADVGECTDVGAAIEQADQAFADYRRADKQAAIAERNVPVRFASAVGGRAQSMRTVEVLVVENVELAIKVLGITDKIRDAILSSARDYRKAFDELPNGIKATFERSM
jgi:DNA repair exonuclease SbcCD ATPase subunit